MFYIFVLYILDYLMLKMINGYLWYEKILGIKILVYV